jgi:hypothetical protein
MEDSCSRPFSSRDTLGPRSKPVTPTQAEWCFRPGLLPPPRPNDGLIHRHTSAPWSRSGDTGSLSPSAIVPSSSSGSPDSVRGELCQKTWPELRCRELRSIVCDGVLHQKRRRRALAPGIRSPGWWKDKRGQAGSNRQLRSRSGNGNQKRETVCRRSTG